MVYLQSIQEQILAVEERTISSMFRLEADDKGRVCMVHEYIAFLYDEEGKLYREVQMIEPQTSSTQGVTDIVRGRDGGVYLYYYVSGNARLVQVDFEKGEISNVQTVADGNKLAFWPEDGFLISDDEKLLLYDTDLPTMERKPIELLTWWDYLLYGRNIQQLTVLEDGRILALHFSNREEMCHALLIEQMSRWEAKRIKGDGVILPRE